MNDLRRQNGNGPEDGRQPGDNAAQRPTPNAGRATDGDAQRDYDVRPGDPLAGPIGSDGQPVYDHVPEDGQEPETVQQPTGDVERGEGQTSGGVRRGASDRTEAGQERSDPRVVGTPNEPQRPAPNGQRPTLNVQRPPDYRPPTTDSGQRPTDSDLHGMLRTIKWVVIALLTLAIVAGAAILGNGLLKQRGGGGASGQPTPLPTSVQETDYPTPGGAAAAAGARSISCLSETGPDATTTSRTFADVSGTECVHRTGSTPETLVLGGKLTGRNTEGTGLSATLNVNGKDCNGGEALSYSRTYTPLYSNCTFTVPANSAVGIKWRFLSPFGGTAAVLRSSRNIAPSITGVAVPKTSESESDQP